MSACVLMYVPANVRACLNNIIFVAGLGLLQMMLFSWFVKGKTQCRIFFSAEVPLLIQMMLGLRSNQKPSAAVAPAVPSALQPLGTLV